MLRLYRLGFFAALRMTDLENILMPKLRMKKMFVLQNCVSIVFLCSLGFAQDTAKAPAQPNISPEVRAKVAQAYRRMPISFVENHGQKDTTVRFYIEGAGGTMFFTDKEVVTEFVKRDSPVERKGKPSPLPGADKSTTAVMEERLVLRRQFLNTASTVQLIGTKPLPGKVNVFRGNDPSKWKQNISTYSEIKYHNLYPGVDVIYSGTNSMLETSVHIVPKADIKPIQFAIVGADKVKLSPNGDLVIETKMGTSTEQKPGAYQVVDGKKILIPAKFVLKKKNTVGFDIGKYDPALPLVIE